MRSNKVLFYTTANQAHTSSGLSQSAIYISVPVTSVILDNDESNPLHGRQLLCHYH